MKGCTCVATTSLSSILFLPRDEKGEGVEPRLCCYIHIKKNNGYRIYCHDSILFSAAQSAALAPQKKVPVKIGSAGFQDPCRNVGRANHIPCYK